MEKDLDDVIAEEEAKEAEASASGIGIFYEFVLKCKAFCGLIFMLACIFCGSVAALNAAKLFSEDGSVRGMMAVLGGIGGFAAAVVVLLPIACLLRIASRE